MHKQKHRHKHKNLSVNRSNISISIILIATQCKCICILRMCICTLLSKMVDHDEEEELLEIGILLLISRRRNRKARKVPANTKKEKRMRSQRSSYERTLLDLSLKSEDCLLYTEVYFRTTSPSFYQFKFSHLFCIFRAGLDSVFVFFRWREHCKHTYAHANAYARPVHTRDKTTEA